MTTADELLDLARETACEAVRAREAVLDLRAAADAMADGAPANETAIRQVAKAYGIPVRHRQLKHIVLNLTDVLLADISSANPQVSKTIRAFAPDRDLRRWESRDALPQSAYHEAAQAAYVAQERADDERALEKQLERCRLALAYPAKLAAHIARAALSGDTTPMLGAFPAE